MVVLHSTHLVYKMYITELCVSRQCVQSKLALVLLEQHTALANTGRDLQGVGQGVRHT